jgi:cell division initiation protein
MRITPLDVKQQQFTIRMFRGFDVQEVDAFLDDIAEDYEAALKENAALREQVAVLEERARAFADLEKTLQDSIVTAQRMSEEIKANARKEAQLLVEEAQLRAEKLLEETRTQEAKIRSEVMHLSRMRRQLAETVRSTLESYQRLLEGDLKDEPDA